MTAAPEGPHAGQFRVPGDTDCGLARQVTVTVEYGHDSRYDHATWSAHSSRAAFVCNAQPVGNQAESSGPARLARPACILDVARLAGVSHQTVLRVLNGHPSIRDDTRSWVLAAISELQFRPNRAARMLSMRRSETIGVLSAAVGSHYGPASSLSAVGDAARTWLLRDGRTPGVGLA